MAITVPAGVTVAWPGTAASIPAGWQRVTALSSLHTRGAAASTDPGAAGGSTSHGHNSDPHTHSGGVAHTHAATVSAQTNTIFGPTSPLAAAAEFDHTHTVPATDSQTGTPASVSAIWNAATVEPPFFAVIWIRSDGTPTGFPAGSICYWPTSSLPPGWSQHGGSAGKYLKGAAATADGGATGGAASHDHAAVGHAHNMASGHTHSMVSGATSLPIGGATTSAPPYSSGALGGFTDTPSHVHSVTTTDATVAIGDTSTVTSANAVSASYDPPFTTVVGIVNTGSGPDRPEGAIVLWTGTLAGIPFGWRICDGTNATLDLRQQFVKCGALPSDAGTTGGATGHSHTSPAGHTHADSGHSHGVLGNTGGIPGFGTQAGGSSLGAAADGQVTNQSLIHGGLRTGAASATGGTLGATAQDTTSTADTRPPYVDIAFLAAPGLLTVTVTAPGNPVTTNNPTVTWTISGGHTQASYTVTLYASDGVTVLWTSGTVVSSSMSQAIPAGHLHQGGTYVIAVESFTTDFFLGDGSLTTVAAFSPSPTVTGVTATPEPSDIPPSVLVQWTQGTLSAGQTFVQTNIERRVLGTTPWQQVGTVTPITTVSFRDYTGASGVTYEYAVTTTTNYGGDILRSAEQSPAPQATLSFAGIWLHLLGNPAVYLLFAANGGTLGRYQDQALIPTWGRAIPTTHIGQQFWRTWTFDGVPILYPSLPGAPGPASVGTQDPWRQIEAFAAAAAGGGPTGLVVVRFGMMGETGYGVVDLGSGSSSTSAGQTQRKDELVVYTPTLVIDEVFYDSSLR